MALTSDNMTVTKPVLKALALSIAEEVDIRDPDWRASTPLRVARNIVFRLRDSPNFEVYDFMKMVEDAIIDRRKFHGEEEG